MQYNRIEFISKLAKNSDLTIKDATYVYDKFLATLSECLYEGNDVYFHEICKFSIKRMTAKVLKHPQNGEPLPMPEYTKLTISPANSLKRDIKQLRVDL